MKVWIVECHTDYEGSYIIGVCSTKLGAIEACVKFLEEREEPLPSYQRLSYFSAEIDNPSEPIELTWYKPF